VPIDTLAACANSLMVTLLATMHLGPLVYETALCGGMPRFLADGL
jgi:hypothetical protein